jgi:hypothetical protein
MKLESGTRIGPYEVSGLLGKGGMGEVYRAHDERLQRDVALKLVAGGEGSHGDDAERMRRMTQEARAASQLNHPNIVGVFDVGAHEGQPYVVTELLEGESLREVVRRGALPWRTALGLAVQIAEGLAAAHERGIVHRDVKPDNVFLTREGRIKILDFGVATWRAPEGEGLTSATAATLSQAGTLVGTVGYMSPEQARGQKVDARADLFAFGCLLYELLSGRESFGGDTPMEILAAVLRDAPTPLSDLVPSLPADLVRIVERCLEKEPARRFQSARDLLFALTLIPTSGSSSGRTEPAGPTAPTAKAAPSPEPPRARGLTAPWLRGALLLALGLLAGGGATLAARPVAAPAVEPPLFRQLTFRRGTVYTARFTLDGATVVYSATWDGQPRELFATVPGTRESRSLGLPETDVALALGSGDVGVIRRSRRGFSPGVLERLPLSGGPPKDLLSDVLWADSNADASRLAVVHRIAGKYVLEYPVGHAVAEAPGLDYPHLSPDGTHLAFIQHDTDDGVGEAGRLVVIDREGHRLYESESWKSIEGLAWRSDAEIWFSASKEGRSMWIRATDLHGKMRLLLRVPGRLVLHDLSADGRVVAERNSYRATLLLGTGPGTPERDVSWQDFSQLGQLSRDGKQLLFSEQGDGAGTGVTAYLGAVAGGTPLRLGDGLALALSPDASHALLKVEDARPDGGPLSPAIHLEVVPVGAGGAERLPAGPLATIAWAAFVPGSSRIVMQAAERGKGERFYLQDLGGGDPRPLSAEGIYVNGDPLSPDGTLLAATLKGKPMLVPLDGSPPRDLPGLADGQVPIGWTADGRTLFVEHPEARAVQISRYDLATAKLEPWRTLSPGDPAGVLGLGRVSVARDGDVYVYESYRLLSDLYVIENVR